MRRHQLVVAVWVALTLPWPALAQTGRATGTVRDTDGRPIRSAIVRATNAQARPSQVTSTTDSKGRWAMIGLASGEWQFAVEAPGFAAAQTSAVVRSSGGAPVVFTLARDLGPLPGALDKSILQALDAASALRDQGRVDQALAAFEDIRQRNPKLTHVHLVLADLYRRKAAQEADPAARTTLLNRAIASYSELLQADGANERARHELESARAEIAATSQPRN